MPISVPLPNIAKHIVEPVGIWLFSFDGVRLGPAIFGVPGYVAYWTVSSLCFGPINTFHRQVLAFEYAWVFIARYLGIGSLSYLRFTEPVALCERNLHRSFTVQASNPSEISLVESRRRLGRPLD